MYITINGQLGSGKSEICRILKEQYGFEIFSTGKIQREMASKLGLNVLQLNQKAKDDYNIDYLIDNALKEYAEKNTDQNVVFDSRMAWHFVGEAFKVHLLVSPLVAAQRVFYNRNSVAEKYTSVEETMGGLIMRKKVEDERYYQVYNVRNNDLRNYDLVIDSSSLSADAVASIIVNEISHFVKKDGKKLIYSAINNVFPTVSLDRLNPNLVASYIEKMKNNETLPLLSVLHHHNYLFVLGDHDLLKAYIDTNTPIIPAILTCQDRDISPAEMDKIIAPALKNIRSWEDAQLIIYPHIPEFLK